jgi:peroxiredoxin (alkyl hydroperoxide reductase subunit C)
MSNVDNDQYIIARVAGKAPEIKGNAYDNGNFTEFSLYNDVINTGKWAVVFFYPLDFTFVCPTEIKEFSAKANEFEKANAKIIGVSVDSEHSHKAWSEGDLGKLNFPLVSDLQKENSINYDVLHDDGMSLRGTFIIDPEGTIHHATINNLPLGRNVDETLRTLKAAQSGDLCPVGWTEGEKTLGKA